MRLSRRPAFERIFHRRDAEDAEAFLAHRSILLNVHHTELTADEFVHKAGHIFAVFDERTQDSGNVSYGVRIHDERFFVKTPGRRDGPTGSRSFDARVAVLRNAVTLYQTISHPAVPVLLNGVECADGPALIREWVDGELLGAPRWKRSDPESAFSRFRRLPAPQILAALDTVMDLHCHLVHAGWIAVDFYDGSLIYNFASGALYVIDLDHYHHGPFRNRWGRMFGSTRFMAPEEFELGAEINERTTAA